MFFNYLKVDLLTIKLLFLSQIL